MTTIRQPASVERAYPTSCDLAMTALRDVHRVRTRLETAVMADGGSALRAALAELEVVTETLTGLVRAIEGGR